MLDIILPGLIMLLMSFSWFAGGVLVIKSSARKNLLLCGLLGYVSLLLYGLYLWIQTIELFILGAVSSVGMLLIVILNSRQNKAIFFLLCISGIGVVMNLTAQILNGGRMPVIIDNPTLEGIRRPRHSLITGKEIFLPLLVDWINLKTEIGGIKLNVGICSPGDVIQLLTGGILFSYYLLKFISSRFGSSAQS